VAHHHLSVCVGDPAAFGLPPYLASLITTETKLELIDALRQSLRRYGGTFAVAGGKNVTIERRDGPVAVASQWGHELADAANTLAPRERVVRAPLVILWYEGPASAARFCFDGHVDHQSGHSVSPLPPGAEIVDGRMILQGPGRLGAFETYTGRMWGLRGKDGEVLWCVDEAPYFEPHVVFGDMILDRYGYPYDLLSGRRHQRVNLLTPTFSPAEGSLPPPSSAVWNSSWSPTSRGAHGSCLLRGAARPRLPIRQGDHRLDNVGRDPVQGLPGIGPVLRQREEDSRTCNIGHG